jgi:DNA integrity scanning protein DisA with diadenylate cyclase activity
MIKIREVKESDIKAIKLILNAYEDKENLINMQCKKYKLTMEFVQEFGRYLTKEAFSTSPELSFELISMYEDEYFDLNFWIESQEKSLDPLLVPVFINSLGDKVDEAIKNTNPMRVSKEIFENFKDTIPYDTRVQIINNSKLIEDEQFLLDNVEYLTADVFKNRNLNIEWSEDLIEKIFANKVLTVRFVLSALTNVKNIFFIEKVLKDSSFKYEPTNETFNVELKNFINRISENQIGYLFDILRTNNPAAFTYDLLGYILNMKDYLTEDFLIENSDLFLKNALFDELVKYARFKDYMDLLVLLKLNEN